MCNKLAIAIVERYVEKGIIINDEYEVYVYSFERLLSQILSLALIFSIAIIFNLVLETLLFYIGFSLLRKTSGGIHAKTSLTCNILSIINEVLFFIVIYITKDTFRNVICLGIIIISLVCCFILAPVDHPNKRFNDNEHRHYKRLCIIVSVLSAIIAVLFNFIRPNNIYVFSYCLGVISANISLVIAFVERRRRNV